MDVAEAVKTAALIFGAITTATGVVALVWQFRKDRQASAKDRQREQEVREHEMELKAVQNADLVNGLDHVKKAVEEVNATVKGAMLMLVDFGKEQAVASTRLDLHEKRLDGHDARLREIQSGKT
jgi:hypothetical protein